MRAEGRGICCCLRVAAARDAAAAAAAATAAAARLCLSRHDLFVSWLELLMLPLSLSVGGGGAGQVWGCVCDSSPFRGGVMIVGWVGVIPPPASTGLPLTLHTHGKKPAPQGKAQEEAPVGFDLIAAITTKLAHQQHQRQCAAFAAAAAASAVIAAAGAALEGRKEVRKTHRGQRPRFDATLDAFPWLLESDPSRWHVVDLSVSHLARWQPAPQAEQNRLLLRLLLSLRAAARFAVLVLQQ
ncbi:hypothetical protein ACSSS7_001725 [Eimeria intestinalis]